MQHLALAEAAAATATAAAATATAAAAAPPAAPAPPYELASTYPAPAVEAGPPPPSFEAALDSSVSPLHLPRNLTASPIYLPYISHISPLYLPCISPFFGQAGCVSGFQLTLLLLHLLKTRKLSLQMGSYHIFRVG